jgi:hypothetical protein
MLTWRTLQPSRAAMLSAFAVESVVISLSHLRPRAIDATKVARVSERIGRTGCGGKLRHSAIRIATLLRPTFKLFAIKCYVRKEMVRSHAHKSCLLSATYSMSILPRLRQPVVCL